MVAVQESMQQWRRSLWRQKRMYSEGGFYDGSGRKYTVVVKEPMVVEEYTWQERILQWQWKKACNSGGGAW